MIIINIQEIYENFKLLAVVWFAVVFIYGISCGFLESFQNWKIDILESDGNTIVNFTKAILKIIWGILCSILFIYCVIEWWGVK